MKENRKVAELYSLVKSQVITSPLGNVVDVDMRTLISLIRMTPEEKIIFKRVLNLWRKLNR